jgi:transposase InsO family protein
MSENGPASVFKAFAKACRTLGIKQFLTRPYTLRTNGKAERVIQTLRREWAYGMPLQKTEERVRCLPRLLAVYNHLGKQSSLGWRSPQLSSPSQSAKKQVKTE